MSYKKWIIENIPTEWKISALGDVTTSITDGKHGDCQNKTNSGYYFISAKDIINGEINYSDAREITKEDFIETHKRTNLEFGDILLTNSGTIGRLAVANDPEKIKTTTFQKSVAIIKPNKKIIYFRYLYYYLLSQTRRIEETSWGTTQKNLLLRDLRSFKLPIPPIIVQERIADFLYLIDSKIKNISQIIESLSELSYVLFKNWFFDFEFIDRNGDPYQSSGGNMKETVYGLIPESWTIQSLDKCADFLNGLALQKYPPENKQEFLPVIKIKELRNGITEKTDKASRNIPDEYIIHNGDVLFSWSGSLLVKIWTEGEGALNQHLFKVTSEYPKWFYLHWLRNYLDKFQRIAAEKATTMGHIKRSHLSNALVLVPDKDVFEKMTTVMSPIIELQIVCKLINQSLTNLRNILLTRLVLGKIQVSGEVE